MHTTVEEAEEVCRALRDGLRDRARRGQAPPTVIVCPPFVSLVPVRDLIDTELMGLGAQNCHWEPAGPYTGEVSVTMLKGVVDYVMVGHSERRAGGETDAQVAKKVAAVGAAGLVPILFVGEQEPTEDAARHTDEQLTKGLSLFDVADRDVLVVYEPAWAVGADHAADPSHVSTEVHRLKDRLRELGSADPKVIYGGTVNRENIDRFAELKVLDGVGATRASLDAGDLMGLLDRVPGTDRSVGP